MSYTLSLGDIEPGDAISASHGVVSVWRAVLSAEVLQAEDALRLVRAVGRAVAVWGALDTSINVQGVTVHDDKRTVDVVTVGGGGPSWVSPEVQTVTEAVRVDDAVRARWPGLGLTATGGHMTAPSGAIDFWQAASPLWDSKLGRGGGPTQAFEEQRNVYSGASDEVHTLRPFVPGIAPTPTPVAPVPGTLPIPSSPLPTSAQHEGFGTWPTVLLVVGAVAVIWFAGRGSRRRPLYY